MADVAERKGVKKKERKKESNSLEPYIINPVRVYPDSFFSLYPPKK